MITLPPRGSRARAVVEYYVIMSSPTRPSTQSHFSCDLVFCIYHPLVACPPLSLFLSISLSLPWFPLSAPCENISRLAPFAPSRRIGVTCGADRRKGARGGVEGWWWQGGSGFGDEEGDEGWFKRVNTSQLRSRRTLLGHWSDRDALHSLLPPYPSPHPHPISLLAWFSWCPFFDCALPSFYNLQLRTEGADSTWIWIRIWLKISISLCFCLFLRKMFYYITITFYQVFNLSSFISMNVSLWKILFSLLLKRGQSLTVSNIIFLSRYLLIDKFFLGQFAKSYILYICIYLNLMWDSFKYTCFLNSFEQYSKCHKTTIFVVIYLSTIK